MPILVLAVCLAALAHRYLQTYAPSNAILARLQREAPSVRAAVVLLVLSAALALGAVLLAGLAADGGPGWLNFLVLIAIWDSFKFAFVALATALSHVLPTAHGCEGYGEAQRLVS